MNFTCFKNFHYFFPILPIIFFNKRYFSWRVKFLGNCEYYLEGDDQYDINKLVGVQEFLSPRKKSMRIGWRWDQNKKKIDLFSFKEINKKFEYELLYSATLNEEVSIKMVFLEDKCMIQVGDKIFKINYKLEHKLCFLSQPYFGGNQTAPHKMNIILKTG